jgi:hypothetical protein
MSSNEAEIPDTRNKNIQLFLFLKQIEITESSGNALLLTIISAIQSTSKIGHSSIRE